MSRKKNTYSDFKKYLQNKLTDKERYAFEKNNQADSFELEALEGANQLDTEQFLQDTDSLHKKINDKHRKKGILVSLRKYNAAASLIIIIGTASYFYLTNRPDLPKDPVYNTPIFEETQQKSIPENMDVDEEINELQEIISEPEINFDEKQKKEIQLKQNIDRSKKRKIAPSSVQMQQQTPIKMRKSIEPVIQQPVNTTDMIKEDKETIDDVGVTEYDIQKKHKSNLINNQESIATATPPQGTLEDFKKWLIASIDKTSLKKNSTTTIELAFIIDVKGNITDITFNNEVEPNLRKEIENLLYSSKKWTPIIKNNSPIKSKILLIFSVIN